MNSIISTKKIIYFLIFLCIAVVSLIVLRSTKSPYNDTPGLTTELLQKDPIKSTKELINYLKIKGHNNYLKEFTFEQETIRFNEQEQPKDTATWYEAVKYPDKFRIDFGDKTSLNSNLNRNDSIFVFRNNKIVHKGPEIQTFMVLEGSIHHYSTEETISRLKKLGIDPDTFSKTTYKSKSTYIIGAKNGDLSVPQIWLDQDRLYAVRRINKSNKSGNLYEVRYGDYKKFGNFWVETWLEFYRDGKLIQTERYKNININPNLDDRVFDPSLYGKFYWY